jgi:polyferredoxin
MVSISFLSSHHSTWYCFCPYSICNLVLGTKLTIVKLTKSRKKEKKKDKERKKTKWRSKEINRERWWTNSKQDKQTLKEKKKKNPSSGTVEFQT